MEKTGKSSFIRDIVIKVFLILLFVLLITLLFPMPNLTPFYDAVFNNNVQTMKDAAENYFTKERMPEKEGDKVKLTLQDMLDKKLILPFLDKDGNECDAEKSYVQVTKKKTEYELEVHLSCGDEENYIVEPIGCYDFCENKVECVCSCDQKVTTNEKGEVTVNKTTTTPSKPSTPSTPNTPSSNDKYKLQYLYSRTLTDVNWVTGNYQTNTEKETDSVKLVDTKTEYTGKKRIDSGKTLYKHVKYAYKDNWTYDTDWTEEVKTLTDNLKLYAERTLYTGQRRYYVDTKQYLHQKYETKDNWKVIDWTTTKYNLTSSVVLTDTRYTVRKTTQTTAGTWSSWIKDTTWRTSKPANTSTKQWSDAYNQKTTSSWVLKYSSYGITGSAPSNSDTRRYDFLYSRMEPCTSACNGNAVVEVKYYNVYEKVSTTEYQYMYRTYNETSSISTDEKVVTNPSSYTANGYTIVKTEYKYKVNEPTKTLVDEKWTDSKTSPAGYVYANRTRTLRTYKYENLGKWVTNYNKLGEYTYNVRTRKQYKYRYNSPEKYVADTIWTESKTSPSGYTYTGETKKTSNVSYVDLGRWVSSKAELGEYTYEVETRKLYRYKYKKTTTKTESKWFDKNPGGDWVYANQTRKVKVN